jgi:hypothetical protein
MQELLFIYHPILDGILDNNCNDNKLNKYNTTMSTGPQEVSMRILEIFPYSVQSIQAS